MDPTEPPPPAPTLEEPRRQFSLRRLMAVVTVWAISLGLARATLVYPSAWPDVFHYAGAFILPPLALLAAPFLPVAWTIIFIHWLKHRSQSLLLTFHVLAFPAVLAATILLGISGGMGAIPNAAEALWMFALALQAVSAIAFCIDCKLQGYPNELRIVGWLAAFIAFESYWLAAMIQSMRTISDR